MKLSVIIVSYNAVDFLRLTLNAVFAACRNIEAEVFVVDNNSMDGAPDMVKREFPDCKLIANKNNPGFAAANNQAILQATGKYILILNPDTIVGEDTFASAISFMESKPEAGGLGIRMLDGSGCFLPESKRGIPSPWTSFTKMAGLSTLFPQSKYFAEYHKGYLNEKENYPIEILAGAFMLFNKDVLNSIGGFDEDFFMYGEDIDLSYRAIKGGYTNYYFSDASIIHFKGESTIKDRIYVSRFYKAMIQFANKHFSKSYGTILKIFIYAGVYLAKLVSSMKQGLSKAVPAASSPTHKILLLKDHMPSQDLIHKLHKNFEVIFIEDLTNQQEGTLVFVQGSMTYKEMIETMDFYKERFHYRFLDTKQQVMIGSDNRFIKGRTLTL
ncbi:glycosyltransferase family 2 protein [Saccharicrinis sp. 156]|uniref:glycosyltransferase family 2 protein n=1 Tax=Saccharicrinis sp. 156 TaxID=3417574 RepID=UPI003D34BF97